MAFLQSPVSVSNSTYGSIPRTDSAQPASNTFSAYNPTWIQDSKPNQRGQMPLVMVDPRLSTVQIDSNRRPQFASDPTRRLSVDCQLPEVMVDPTTRRPDITSRVVDPGVSGADLNSFNDDDEESVTSFDTMGFENRIRHEELDRMSDNEDVEIGSNVGGDGYGANVRSVAGYYRMPIQTAALSTLPGAAVAGEGGYSIKSAKASRSGSATASGTATPSPICYCCHHAISSPTSLRTACGHHYDLLCLQHLLTHSIHTLTLPTCCKTPIPTRSFLHLLPYNSSIRKAWLEREVEMMVLPEERERVYCPGTGCGAFVGGVERNQQRTVMECARCGEGVCSTCQREAHASTPPVAPSISTFSSPSTSRSSSRSLDRNQSQCQPTIDRGERAFLETSRERGWQRCFQCRRVVDVEEGCNHVTCVCGAEFCYACGSVWKPRSCECGVFPSGRVARE